MTDEEARKLDVTCLARPQAGPDGAKGVLLLALTVVRATNWVSEAELAGNPTAGTILVSRLTGLVDAVTSFVFSSVRSKLDAILAAKDLAEVKELAAAAVALTYPESQLHLEQNNEIFKTYIGGEYAKGDEKDSSGEGGADSPAAGTD